MRSRNGDPKCCGRICCGRLLEPSFSMSISEGNSSASSWERRGVLGVNVGAGTSIGISWVWDDSGGGTDSVGGAAFGCDAHGSLATGWVESRTHAAAKLLPRGGLNLVTANNPLDWDLGCKGGGRFCTDLALASS